MLKKTVTQLVQQFKAEHPGEDSPYIVVGRHHRKFSSKDKKNESISSIGGPFSEASEESATIGVPRQLSGQLKNSMAEAMLEKEEHAIDVMRERKVKELLLKQAKDRERAELVSYF